MKKEDVQKKTIYVLEGVLKVSVNSNTSRENISCWDSLKHIELIFLLEDVFNVQFDENEIANLNSVDEIVNQVLRKI